MQCWCKTIASYFGWTPGHLWSVNLKIAQSSLLAVTSNLHQVDKCGFALGEMGAQPLTAYLFQTYTPMWMIYISIIVSSLNLMLFISMQVLVTCYRNGLGTKKGVNGVTEGEIDNTQV